MSFLTIDEFIMLVGFGFGYYAFAIIAKRIKQLKQRVDELEKRPLSSTEE